MEPKNEGLEEIVFFAKGFVFSVQSGPLVVNGVMAPL